MRFARWVFLLAGVSGVLIVAPMYLEGRFFEQYPPATNRPEFYYGFAGVTLAWQFLFLVIASDPIRYRLAMLPAMLEKAGFALVIPVLYAQQRELDALRAEARTWWPRRIAIRSAWGWPIASAIRCRTSRIRASS